MDEAGGRGEEDEEGLEEDEDDDSDLDLVVIPEIEPMNLGTVVNTMQACIRAKRSRAAKKQMISLMLFKMSLIA